ncbi:arsenate reductase (glutaredoxin) [Pseudogemmobacter sonorensis]|uniref:arsenate reductase (glutaredoxin) n=1 Tax=Pseudogemmobacter sonorensis TaxID=2989681 RepID=UPI00367B5D6C
MKAVIWHNPGCGTSRSALAALRAAGYAPEVVEYLKTGWDPAGLRALLSDAGLTPRQALRLRGTPAEALGLTAPETSDEALLLAMVAHPVLVERPFVRIGDRAALCRPIERLRDLLDAAAA